MEGMGKDGTDGKEETVGTEQNGTERNVSYGSERKEREEQKERKERKDRKEGVVFPLYVPFRYVLPSFVSFLPFITFSSKKYSTPANNSLGPFEGDAHNVVTKDIPVQHIPLVGIFRYNIFSQ